ncbi:MAG: hypothetical protein A3F46_01490 [Legionellales bacterium RIFCSPHIGHO2_12_FULL_42_9]|nr:MAG: hypothetical protein A3F46_01490 [Legionellales bacterium RIFCSPHIGHO2_12_FULL_42_9]
MLRHIEYLVIALFLGLVGCHHTPSSTTSFTLLQKTTTQTRQAAPFNQVVVKGGRINVNLHTGYTRPKVILHGELSDVQQVVTKVKNNTLFVIEGEKHPYYGPLTVDIRTRNLDSFTYNGVGTITGPLLNTRHLNLSITNSGNTYLAGHIGLSRLAVYGSGDVRLSGVSGHNIQVIMGGRPHVQLVGIFNVDNLNLYGDGFLSGYWVKNDRLVIKEHGNVHLQLAGTANSMEVELWNHADFNGRYLRASRAFVKTHDQSVAKLSAIRRQHTLASDASDIYFYNLPEMRTDFMAYDGAVLDMRDWNLLCEQEYTIYNK